MTTKLKPAKSPFAAVWGVWEEREVPEWHSKGTGVTRALLNKLYSVQISQHLTVWGIVIHLWIKRHDGQPVRSWGDMQRIKNELVGPERTGVEVYPKESRKVDDANMYHLWVLPADFELPFCLQRGCA